MIAEKWCHIAAKVKIGCAADRSGIISPLDLEGSCGRSATSSREQMRYPLESAIRRRFVPALVEVLMSSIFTRVSQFGLFHFTQRLIAIHDSVRIGASTMQSPVYFARRNARSCGEQTRNLFRSAIRRRFVPALDRILTRQFLEPDSAENYGNLQLVNHILRSAFLLWANRCLTLFSRKMRVSA